MQGTSRQRSFGRSRRDITFVKQFKMHTKQCLAYGRIVRFEWADDTASLAVERAILPNWRKVNGSPDVTYAISLSASGATVLENGIVVEAELDSANLAHHLKRHCHINVATHSPDFVFIHAGVVSIGKGVVLIPGRSYSGKSTLVRELVKLGGRYFSDEYAVIDREGNVLAFPRALHLRMEGEALGLFIPAPQLNWSEEMPPSPVRAVVFTDYKTGHQWAPGAVSQGRSALLLLEHTVCARSDPAKAIAILPRILESAAVTNSLRGEAVPTAQAILDWLGP